MGSSDGNCRSFGRMCFKGLKTTKDGCMLCCMIVSAT